MRNHMLSLAAGGLLAMALVVGGCEQKTTMGVAPVEECSIDLHNLSGMFIAQKAAPDRGEYLDKDFRMLFFEEDGKKKLLHTGGRVFPQLPLTEKFNYEFTKFVDEAETEALYTANFVQDFEAKELEERKKTNKDLGWKLEGMVYVRLDEKRCRLKVSDMYVTYVEGKRIEDFNMGGQSAYLISEETRYSMVTCPPARKREKPEENRQGELIAWEKAEPDPNRDESYPRGPKGTMVPDGKPVHWMWIDPEMNEKTAEEGCTYNLDVYFDDLPVESLQDVAVTPGKKWTYWSFEMTHDVIEKPTFIEIHRHKVCGAEDTTIEAVCNVVITEPKEPAEGEAAPAEGGEG
jgi:hypothetical protein